MPQWIPTVDFDDIDDEDVVRFDHGGKTYALYRVEDKTYASDGLCTHEKVHRERPAVPRQASLISPGYAEAASDEATSRRCGC